MLSMLVEVVDDIGNREHCGFLEAPLEAHPSLGGALFEAVTKLLCIQQWQEHPEVVMDQCVLEEVSK